MARDGRRVVVTGLGLISPVGNTPDALWSALNEGRSGVAPLQSLPGNVLPANAAGEAREFHSEIEDFGPLEKQLQRSIKKGLKMMCREIAMGVAAAQRALAHAGLDQPSVRDPERTGVVYGADYILTMPEEFADGVRQCLDDNRQFHMERWAEEGLPKVDPLWLLKYLPNMPASHIAIYNDLRGPNNSLTMREAAANAAVGEAYCTIMRGDADMMLAGATGTRVHPLRTIHVAMQEELARDAAPERLCRPFDRDRTGMVIGEGAGAIVLETLESAQRRGATIYAEVAGHGTSSVVDRDGTPRFGRALRNVIEMCLDSSGCGRGELGHVHAHGLATRRLDAEEAQAIAEVFERPIPVVAAKSHFGNLGAGGGLVELIGSVLALHHDRLFPVLNYETPDEACPVSVARGGESPGDSFVNLSVTPLAQASAVLLRKVRG